MPHAAYDNWESYPGAVHHTMTDPHTGVVVNSWDTALPFVTQARKYRPASTNNPIRSDKTRADSNWLAVGGRRQGGYHSVFYQNNPTAYIIRLSGESQSPDNGKDLGDVRPVDSSLPATVRRQALAQFTEREVSLGAATRELGSTLKMVGNMATGMAKGLDDLMYALQAKNRGAAAKGLALDKMSSWKKIPSAYLEYLYGWRPTSEDVSNAFDSLNTRKSEGERLLYYLKKHRTLRGIETFENGQFDGYIKTRDTYEITQKCRVRYAFGLPDWYWEKLPTVAPFGTLYETTRLSFVLDWFLPIGEFIGAMEAAQLWPFFVGAVESEKRTARLVNREIIPTNFRQTLGSFPGYREDYWYRRTPISLAGGILSAVPSLRNPLSLSHAAQGLSLLTQAFQKWR